LLAVGVGLASLTHLCHAIFFLTLSSQLLGSSGLRLDWCVFAPGSLASFLGAMLLLNRSREIGWQSSVFFLFLIQSYFFGYFCLDHVRMLEPGPERTWYESPT